MSTREGEAGHRRERQAGAVLPGSLPPAPSHPSGAPHRTHPDTACFWEGPSPPTHVALSISAGAGTHIKCERGIARDLLAHYFPSASLFEQLSGAPGEQTPVFPNPQDSGSRALLLERFPRAGDSRGPGFGQNGAPKVAVRATPTGGGQREQRLSGQVLFPVAFSSRTSDEMFKLEILV